MEMVVSANVLDGIFLKRVMRGLAQTVGPRYWHDFVVYAFLNGWLNCSKNGTYTFSHYMASFYENIYFYIILSNNNLITKILDAG